MYVLALGQLLLPFAAWRMNRLKRNGLWKESRHHGQGKILYKLEALSRKQSMYRTPIIRAVSFSPLDQSLFAQTHRAASKRLCTSEILSKSTSSCARLPHILMLFRTFDEKEYPRGSINSIRAKDFMVRTSLTGMGCRACAAELPLEQRQFGDRERQSSNMRNCLMYMQAYENVLLFLGSNHILVLGANGMVTTYAAACKQHFYSALRRPCS